LFGFLSILLFFSQQFLYSNDWNIYCVNQGTSTSFFCRVWIIIFQTSNPFSYIFFPLQAMDGNDAAKVQHDCCVVSFFCVYLFCVCPKLYMFF
jgi:hypothetical protein